jgi:hypothetical protein
MNKLIISWFSLYAIAVFLTSIYSGGGGLVATTLTQPLSATENATIHVASTQSYRTSGTVYIENEMVHHTGKAATTLTGLTRAYNHTNQVAHNVVGTPVYSQEMGTINQASGSFVASSDIAGGEISASGFNISFLLRSVPQIVMWDYPFLKGGQMEYLRILLQMVGVGLTVSLVLATVNVFTKVFS